MNLEPGLIVVVAAALIFYLRLILLQRQRARQAAAARSTGLAAKRKGKGRPAAPPAPGYSILSQNRRNQVIGAAGLAALLAGMLLRAGALGALPAEPYWWLLTGAGIVAFSWMFAL